MSTTRITGITSGFDTDALIEDLMSAEQKKYDKLEKDKQYLEWQQDEYREIMSTLTGFQSQYFDVLNSDTNIRSSSSFAKFSSSVTVNGVSNSALTVSANADVLNFNHTISEIRSLATKDTWNGDTSYLSSINSSGISSEALESMKTDGMEFSLSIDKSAKVITLTSDELETASGGDDLSVDELVTALNSKISDVFGSDFDGIVQKVTIDGNEEIKFDYPGNDIAILDTGDLGTLDTLGIESGSSNYGYASKSIGEALGITEEDLENLSINGVEITGLSIEDDIDDMIRKINAIDAGVKLSYSEIEDRFILQAEDEGTLNNITLDNDETVDFFSKLSIEDGANRTEATNAIITIDGVEIVKSSNNFTLEGITYNLNSEYSGDDIDISVSQNTDEIYDFIKGFVESYNAIVEDLNTTLSESRDYDYEPLTDDERDAMTEDEIEAWETQAKKGILRSDTTLDNMLTKMRQALYESVEDVGLTLKDMGITTSSEYTDRGKLEIDEYTLKDAISNNYSDVVKLFTSESDIDYTDGDNRSERYEENGLAYRLYDLIQDHVRTTRDTDGNKGILLEKAGKEGDTSYYTNSLTEKIDEYDDRIYEALEYLADKEDYYYEMFANMEAALSEMNSQMASFTSQLGTSS